MKYSPSIYHNETYCVVLFLNARSLGKLKMQQNVFCFVFYHWACIIIVQFLILWNK